MHIVTIISEYTVTFIIENVLRNVLMFNISLCSCDKCVYIQHCIQGDKEKAFGLQKTLLDLQRNRQKGEIYKQTVRVAATKKFRG